MQVFVLFEIQRISQLASGFAISQKANISTCLTNISTCLRFRNISKCQYLNLPANISNKMKTWSQIVIISNTTYYLKPLSQISRYLKPLSQIAYYLKLLSQTFIISTARSLSQTLDIFSLSQNTHYLNCPVYKNPLSQITWKPAWDRMK